MIEKSELPAEVQAPSKIIKRKRKQKVWKPTDEELAQAEMLAGMGLRDAEIANYLGYFPQVFGAFKWNSIELTEAILRGRAKATANVAGSVYKRAIAGSSIDAMFWLKCVAGWQEKPKEQTINVEKKIEFIMPEIIKDPQQWAATVEVEARESEKENNRRLIEMLGEDAELISDDLA